MERLELVNEYAKTTHQIVDSEHTPALANLGSSYSAHLLVSSAYQKQLYSPPSGSYQFNGLSTQVAPESSGLSRFDGVHKSIVSLMKSYKALTREYTPG